MVIATALRELWSGFTQEAVAAKLTAAGHPTRQATVSAWLNGRAMSPALMNEVEQAFDKPKGWILTHAGYVDVLGLLPFTGGALAHKVETLAALQEQLVAELAAQQAPEPPGARHEPAPRRPQRQR